MVCPLAPIAGNAMHDEKREKAQPIKPKPFAAVNETINLAFYVLILPE